MNLQFRKALPEDIPGLWKIFQSAIARRKADGSTQWQDGYPNPDVLARDIAQGTGWVMWENEEMLGYVAIMINDEPEYAKLKGKWLTDADFVLFHRVVVAENHLGKGLAKRILQFVEEFAKGIGIQSIKADTNFDNFVMMHIFEKLGYVYCGEVSFRGTPRRAYEKVLLNKV